MICKTCGKENPDHQDYCSYCGASGNDYKDVKTVTEMYRAAGFVEGTSYDGYLIRSLSFGLKLMAVLEAIIVIIMVFVNLSIFVDSIYEGNGQYFYSTTPAKRLTVDMDEQGWFDEDYIDPMGKGFYAAGTIFSVVSAEKTEDDPEIVLFMEYRPADNGRTGKVVRMAPVHVSQLSNSGYIYIQAEKAFEEGKSVRVHDYIGDMTKVGIISVIVGLVAGLSSYSINKRKCEDYNEIPPQLLLWNVVITLAVVAVLFAGFNLLTMAK